MTAGGETSATRQRSDEYVNSGHWPHPNDRPCRDCGHVWFRGERRHEYDVDSLESLPDRHEDVHVVCILCLQQREFEREEGEEDRTARRWHW